MKKGIRRTQDGNPNPGGMELLITRLPTLVDIDKMGLKELREQYKRLEGEAIDQSQKLSDVCAKLHEMNVIAHNISSLIFALCDSYEAGDQAAILLQVKNLSDQRKAPKRKVH